MNHATWLRLPNLADQLLETRTWFFRIVLYSTVFLLVGFVPCRAQTTTIDFDPPQFPAGEQLQTVGIVTFPDSPVVFAPNNTTTFTPPNALRSSGTCSDSTCSSGAYMMRMYFGQLLNALSLRAGNFGTSTLCIPENATCPVAARLEGFDVNGNRVADSGDVQVGDASHGSITTELAVADPSGSIAYAILFMGKGTAHSDYGNPVPAQIDHLSFTSTGVTTVNGNTPPSIAIATPTPQQSFAYPFQVTFSGSVSAPAGLRAFCTALNNTVIPPSSQCNQTGLLDLSGNFTIAINPADLAPGTNTLSAFVYDIANRSAAATVTLSLQTPPVPSIVIFEPTAEYCLGGLVQSGVCSLNSASNVKMTGGGTIPGGLLAFCTGANEPTPPPPALCNQTSQFFLNVPVPAAMVMPGLNTLDAYAYDRWGQLAQAHVSVVLPADPQIVAMEVTQGIQTTAIPLNTPGTPVPYNGVKLFAGGKTIVRVFANTTAGTLPDVDVLLLGTWDEFDTGVQNQLLGLLFADNGTLTLTAGGTSVSDAQRADPNGAFVFTLPPDWVTGQGGSITLYAVVNPDGFEVPPVPSCSGCQANSLMTLTNITFNGMSGITISPVALTWTDSSGAHPPNPDPSAAFAEIASVSPLSGAGLNVAPYLGTIDVSDLVSYAQNNGLDYQGLSSLVAGRVSEVEDIHNPPGFIFGVMNGVVGTVTDVGLEYPQVYAWPPRISEVAVADQNRPLTSLGHEFFHQLHYYHAGTSCNSAFPSVGWPPDDRGDIHGIGLDRSLESAGTYRVIAPGAPGQLPEVVDFMSYCASGEAMAWISTNNWNAWGSDFPNGVIPCDVMGCTSAVVTESAPPAHQPTLRVTASVDMSGTATIGRVGPGDGRKVVTASNPTDQSSYYVVIRDAANGIVSRTRVTPLVSHQHNKHTIYLSAEVAALNAASVEIEANGSVVARRDRSPHAPTVTLLSPAAGTRLSGASINMVKWQAQDADGNPLSVRVEYSTDGGKTYRVLTTGVTADHVALPGSFFSRSNDARVRVRVNDGFNEAIAVSGPLQAEGTLPVVHISEPASGIHSRNDVALRLVGSAYDDAGRLLPSDALKWYDGDHFLGRGRQLSAFDREPGRRTIRLVARDEDREATASVDVHIDAVTPIFIGLKIPSTVDQREDEMRIVLGSSIPGVVVVGDRGYPVETKPKELKVVIPKGKEDLTLPLVLVAQGKTVTYVARVKRN
jgi:hypothetical protein